MLARYSLYEFILFEIIRIIIIFMFYLYKDYYKSSTHKCKVAIIVSAILNMLPGMYYAIVHGKRYMFPPLGLFNIILDAMFYYLLPLQGRVVFTILALFLSLLMSYWRY